MCDNENLLLLWPIKTAILPSAPHCFSPLFLANIFAQINLLGTTFTVPVKENICIILLLNEFADSSRFDYGVVPVFSLKMLFLKTPTGPFPTTRAKSTTENWKVFIILHHYNKPPASLFLPPFHPLRFL